MKDQSQRKQKIALVGVGWAGCSIVEIIKQQDLSKELKTISMDRDSKILEQSFANVKLLIPSSLKEA